MLTIFLATYGAVFVAEIVGDKLLYTTGVLATRYKTLPIMIGMAFAFMLKMGVAVAVGEAISKLPPWLVACVTAASFIGVAITVWRKDERRVRAERGLGAQSRHGFLRGDFLFRVGRRGPDHRGGRCARSIHVPGSLVVGWARSPRWSPKASLAASIGAGVRGWIQEHVPPKIIRYAGVGALVLLGILSVIETLDGRPRLTAADQKRRTALGFIVCLGIVSLFADMTYEGAHSSIGPYLQNLGASAAEVAIIAGSRRNAGREPALFFRAAWPAARTPTGPSRCSAMR